MLVVNNLTKRIHGNEILNKVSCQFEGIFGLIGPNGAGKTTLLKIIANTDQKYEGFIDRSQIEQIGYLPQDFKPYKNLKIDEILNHFGILKGLKNKNKRLAQIDNVLKEVNLNKFREYKTKELSGGMIRRLGIAQALMGNPDLLIVDEPFNGLDLEEKIRLKCLLKNITLTKEIKIIITSHLVDDLEEICSNIGFLISGELIKYGEKHEIFNEFKNKIWEVCSESELKNYDKIPIILSETKIDNTSSNFRFYSEENTGIGKIIPPTIRDIYLYYVRTVNNDD